MKKIHATVAAAAVMLAAAAGLGPLASAAPVPQSAAAQASLGIDLGPLGTLTIPLTGGTFSGTIDDETGAIAGDIDFPETTSNIDLDGTPATAKTALGIDGLTGTIAADNTVTASGVFRLNLMAVQSGQDPALELDPCNWSGQATLTGTFDPASRIVTIAQTGFAFGSTSDSCGGAGDLLTGYLTAPATELSFTIDLDAAPEEPTTTTTAAPTTTTTTVQTDATPAQPVQNTASYTG